MSKHILVIFDEGTSDSVSDVLREVIDKWADSNDIPLVVLSTGELKSPFLVAFPFESMLKASENHD